MRVSFSQQDLDTLRTSYAEGGIAAALAALPQRSRGTIQGTAWRLGLRSRNSPRAPFSDAEVAILRTVYVEHGLKAALERLPGRSRQAVYVKVNRLGLQTKHRPVREGIYRKVAGEALELRKQGLSHSEIGSALGICEAAAANAVLVGECRAGGHRSLERGPDGRISAAGRERLRVMLRKGMKHRDIQVRCGISASTVTRERRLYERELRERKLAPLPPPGGGERYSGARIPAEKRREVERLYLEGYGTGKVSAATGVSKTHCGRARNRLVRRLKRKGECLPGCDADGRRRIVKGHLRAIPPHSMAELRRLLLSGEHSVTECARRAAIGGSTAYRVFHQLEAEFAAQGRVLPVKRRGASKKDGVRLTASLPGGRRGIDRYRVLLGRMSPAEARAQVAAEYDECRRAELENERLEEARRRADLHAPKSFEEKLRLVEQGRATISIERPMLPVEPLFSGAGCTLA